ncbi:MAG: RagB/SusD family nutrient uptake outer membrane protein [Bacteroidales bacterium]|nr:RagB/SusD family nutrient uptake outer membrane protein [Bacteroidales bacterium]
MNKYIISLAAAAMALTACDDFLQREPLSFGSEETYFKSDDDLELSVNVFYTYLPQNSNLWGGLYTGDNSSDNQSSGGANSLFYEGDLMTGAASGTWSTSGAFADLRSINFFMNKVKEKGLANFSGSADLVKHYYGEGFFFRAYKHWILLETFGDAPILDYMVDDDQASLAAASKRYPRNEVARFILQDLDSAAYYCMSTPPASGRIYRDVALALKSRVALFEATWERYHAGTAFVPGNSKWPGKSHWPDFSFKAGSAEAEVNFFLDQCIDASEKAVANHPLDADYQAMFVNWEAAFGDNDEVILARYYYPGVLTHSCSAYLKGGGGCGVTRAAVNSFLMANGLPIYDSNSGYHGDETSYEEFLDRDPRLTGSVRAAGFLRETYQTASGAWVNDTIFYYKPALTASSTERATTGYELQKWCSDDTDQRVQSNCYTAVPLIRSAEIMLNYIEAYYEKNGNLGGNCDTYWRAIRNRAGVDPDYNKTIAATDLSQENDLAVWSKGKEVSTTLYNIRRERRCELIAEGQRFDDLKRWRALDKMVDYQIEGFNLWAKMYEMWSSTELSAGVVSQSSVSTYIRVLQRDASSKTYQGYNFPKPHYLYAIPINQFILTVDDSGSSTLYQNPGWPSDFDGTADYSYDCD